MFRYLRLLIAWEISSLTRFYDSLTQILKLEHDTGQLLDLCVCAEKRTEDDDEKFSLPEDGRHAVLINGAFNHHYDIQGLLRSLKPKLNRESRLVVVAYNSYLSWLYALANRLGIRKGDMPTTFLTRNDVRVVCKLAGYQLVRLKPVAYFPFRLLGLGTLINRFLAAIPFFRWMGLASVMVLRPIVRSEAKPSLSIIIPARNEAGNIENAITRLTDFDDVDYEVIYVEGHSTDNTWDEIKRVQEKYKDSHTIHVYQQTGKGKADAVRLGFACAEKDLVTILDADLTMPPELLRTFYDAYTGGLGDFINGNRLLYPMEGEAMRFLNHLGNVFFAKALSFVLDARLGDSLCGTKLLTRKDYERVISWRNHFGDFDPFGDFELLFSAAQLGLDIVDVPIRYRDRTYGETNISRFRHGLMLLKMTTIGFFRIRCGQR